MGISAILDVVIGLVFIFLIFSLLVSGAHELAARALETRSKQLWAALHALMDVDERSDEEIKKEKRRTSVFGIWRKADKRPHAGTSSNDTWTEKLYSHALVSKLDDTKIFARTRLNHIEPDDFSRVVIDMLAPKDGKTTVEAVTQNLKELKDKGDTRGAAPFLDDIDVLARQAAGDIDRLRSEISTWFDNRMIALSTAYRKRTRWWMFLIGVIVAVGFNVNALHATQELYRSEALRDAVAEQAIGVVEACEAEEADAVDACVDREVANVAEKVELPVWWTDGGIGEEADLGSAIGWLIAAGALSMGATFWFDTLRRLSGIRQSLSG